MKESIISINLVGATLSSLAITLTGGLDGMFKMLLLLVIVDYITGLMIAYKDKKLSSSIGFQGLAKKFSMLMICAICHCIDAYIINNGTSALRTMSLLFYISNEGISVLENAGNLGVPIPSKLKNVLLQITDEKDTKS